MSRRVMVPLDRSQHAETALAILSELLDSGDEVILLSVAEPAQQTQVDFKAGRITTGYLPGHGGITSGSRPDLPVYGETMDQVIQGQLDELQDYLRTHVAALETQGFGVRLISEIRNDSAQAIVEVARRCQPNFIVMVRTTHPGIGERLFGSVAQQVIR